MATVEVSGICGLTSTAESKLSRQTFEATLKEVVKGKRLSASKMNKLTEVSMELMEYDTRLVSILYRTHKSLPASSKISSLYCFDALCRAARHHVVKQNLSGDINSEKGNCATFLQKIEGVLDGLFQDLLISGIPEAKEKTKKILDIWTKSSTFPSNVLTRLSALGVAAEIPKGACRISLLHVLKTKHASSSITTTDPRKHPTPPFEITPPPAVVTPTAESAQAALLALLSSAAAAKSVPGSQTVTNTTSQVSGTPPQPQSQPQLEQIQLALLQQLTKNTNSSAGIPVGLPSQQATPIPLSHVPTYLSIGAPQQNFNYPGPSSHSPPNPNPEPYAVPDRKDPRPSRFGDAVDRGPGRGRGTYHDDRRGGFGGGPPPPRGELRGRGRGQDSFRGGGRFGGRGRDRESAPWERERDGDWSPSSRRRSSRSRSPVSRPAGNQNGRPYSPPRRPSIAPPAEGPRALLLGASEAGKDEFGRDIRPTSEEPEDNSSAGTRPRDTYTRDSSKSVDEVLDKPRQERIPPAPSADVSSSVANKYNTGQAVGLEHFDITTFDPTDALSWKSLGDAFQVTNGYVPSQEELMQLVMSSMGMVMGMGLGGAGGTPAGLGEGGMPAGGTGGEFTAQDWGAAAYGNQPYEQGSDAVILEPDGGGPKTNGVPEIQNPENGDSGGGGAGGKMQKVGDKWVFVRDGA
ncbi:hypothetical protein M0805_003972 [Coniferiporia weirii]|nr:hypothetical protein M0805_003972 [Coniferiporia weirii]